MAINCERCKKPVKLHQSLLNMNQSNYDLVLSTLSTLPEESTFDFSSFQVEPIAPSTSDSTKQNSRAQSPTPPASTSEQETPKLNRRKSLLQTQSKFLNPADSFVFLSNSQILPSSLTTSAFAPSYPSALAKMAQESSKTNNNMSDRLKNLSRIFDLLNSEQQFDQPMCQDCTELLLEVLHKKLAGFSTERDVYQAYVKQIDQEVNGQTKPSKVTSKDIEKLEAEKEAVLVTLNEFEAQLKQLEEEREELERESAELDQLEEEYWRDYNEYELQCQAFEDEKESANRSYEASLQELELLHRTNVFNDTFHISYDGPFGMINGLRLGRLPSQQTDWAEINAAWGQTLLVLFLVANKLDFNFHTYKLIPRGSYSKIEKIDDDNTAYELYYTPDLSFGKLFMNRRFDHAMVAYLDCLQQLADHIEGRDPNIKLPYRVNKDKIAGLSVRLQFNSEETWTKALRLTLIDTKWALAFASDDKRK